jgi:hypothetical protein
MMEEHLTLIMMIGEIEYSSAGLIRDPVGTHSSRTIMVPAVSQLFAASSAGTPYEELRRLVLKENVLQKSSMAGRAETFRRLRELYALDPAMPVYRALRYFWPFSPQEQPLLAMLCALARDPVLRASAAAVLGTPHGSPMPKAAMEAHLAAAFPNRYSAEVLAGMTRRLLSSWTQSGHLAGRSRKVSAAPKTGPASVAYALLLGHLQGVRGGLLFETPWVAALDVPVEKAHEFAQDASRRGWIDYRRAGNVIDIQFHRIPGIQ